MKVYAKTTFILDGSRVREGVVMDWPEGKDLPKHLAPVAEKKPVKADEPVVIAGKRGRKPTTIHEEVLNTPDGPQVPDDVI